MRSSASGAATATQLERPGVFDHLRGVVRPLCSLGVPVDRRDSGGYRRRKRVYLEQLQRAEAERRAAERLERQERSLTLGGLLSLTAREFELRVGEVLAEHGYTEIEHVGKAGDLGIDLFVTSPSGERFGVQCKRYAPDKLVRAPEVRLLYGDMTHAHVRGAFITTSGFTADATAYAESHRIVLIDGSRLAKLVAATLPDVALDEPSPATL